MSAEFHALNELEAEARALIRCPICLEKFRVPKVLSCQHTFCLRCLEGCFEATQAQRLVTASNFPCPTCRKTCYVPLGGLDKLPTDIKMKQIADLWEKMESSGLQADASQPDPVEDGGNSVLCAVCVYQNTRQTAASFCLQCTKALCSKCLGQHSRTTLFRDHCVISMAGQDERSDPVGGQCNEHGNEVELYCCTECKRGLCSVCVLLPEHEAHTIRKRTSLSNEQGSCNLSDMLEDLELRSGKLAKAIKSIDYMKKEIVRLTTESEKEIERSYRQAKQKLKDARLKLVEEVRAAKEERLNLVTLAEKKFLEEQNSAKKLNDSLRKKLNVKDLTPRDDEAMKKLAEDLQKPQPTLDSTLGRYISFFPDIDVRLGTTRVQSLEGIDPSLFPSESDQSGNASVLTDGAAERSPGNSGKDCPSVGGGSLKMTAKECHGRNLTSAVSRAKNENQKDAVLQTLVRTLSIRASAAAAKHHSLSVVATKHAAEDAVINGTSNDFINCRDCCFLDNDLLCVTGQSRSSEGLVKIFNTRTLEVVRSFDRSLKMRPWGLTRCQDSGHLSSVLVTNQEGSTVNLVKPDGAVRELSMSLGTPRIKKPTGIAMTKTGQYVITDTALVSPRATRIGLYALRSGKLQLVRRLAGCGSGDGEVLRPNFIAVDSCDRVLVSDSESRNVKVFNLRGEQLLKFSSCGPDGQELLPQGLAVDGASNIFVVDQSTGCVALYSPDGDLINRSILGDLNTAWGISFNVEQKLIAVATDLGPKVFRI